MADDEVADEGLHRRQEEMMMTLQPKTVLLDDGLGELAQPRVRDRGLVGLFGRAEVTDCAECELNIPLGHGLWLLLKQREQNTADAG